MKNKLFTICAFTMISASTFAAAPPPLTMKCQTFDTNGRNEIETIVFEYGMGQQALKLKEAKGIIAEVSDDNELIPGLYDVKIYLKDSIVAAKGVTQSDNHVNGVHVVQITGRRAISISCGI